MRQKLHHIIYIVIAALLMMGCTGANKDTTSNREPQASDTLYTWRAAMKIYGYQPERALQIIDSAVIVGNMSEVWADEDKDPAVKVSNTYAPKESAEAAVKVGTYTVTFEFIDPDNNKVVSKGKLSNVEVEMGKNKQEATSSLSTGDAELTEM